MSLLEISPEQTRKMQMKSLEMALYFDEFCQKNGLTWFFCGGCCIGAVRNKGFIPWDDDVDGFMPREDYERLKKIWKDTKEYSIQYPTKELDTQNQFVILCPVVDRKFETPEETEAFINAMNHTARRIKDCTCVAGFLLPDELLEKGIDGDSPAAAFMETLAVKHAQYVYFVPEKSEKKYNLNEAIFFASLVLI